MTYIKSKTTPSGVQSGCSNGWSDKLKFEWRKERGIQIEKEKWTDITRGRKYSLYNADSWAFIYIKITTPTLIMAF